MIYIKDLSLNKYYVYFNASVKEYWCLYRQNEHIYVVIDPKLNSHSNPTNERYFSKGYTKSFDNKEDAINCMQTANIFR